MYSDWAEYSLIDLKNLWKLKWGNSDADKTPIKENYVKNQIKLRLKYKNKNIFNSLPSLIFHHLIDKCFIWNCKCGWYDAVLNDIVPFRKTS